MKKEMIELLEELKHFNFQYRIGNPLILDVEYDAKKEVFASEHPDHPFVVKIEPTPVPEHRKQKLPVAMRSLDKLKSLKELKKWLVKCGLGDDDTVSIGPKWNGNSLLDDNFSSCNPSWSRGGDENEGQRCDGHLALINHGKSDTLRFTGGEVIISKKNWAEHWAGKINPRTGEPYKTLLGVVGGLLRHDTPDEKLKHVDYIKYYSPELEDGDFVEAINEINASNKVKHPHKLYVVGELTDEIMNNLYSIWSEDYEIDGLVVNIVSGDLRKKLGRDPKSGNPRYAMAYKANFEERFETTVKAVNAKVSKSGYLKPTVALERVIIDGAAVQNPTGYNFKWIFDNNIAPGSVVDVIKSGSVIPKIMSTKGYIPEYVESVADKFSECPACGEPTAWNESYVELCCTNKECPGKKLAEIIFFFDTMGFKEFGEGTIGALFECGYDSVEQILDLCEDKALFVGIEGLGEASFENFRTQVDKMYDDGVALSNLMHASNLFKGVGSTKIQLILDNIDLEMKTAEDTLPMAKGEVVQWEDLTKINGVGTETAKSFMTGLRKFIDFYFFDMQKVKLSRIKTQVQVVSGSKCTGFKVCFSGVRDKDLEVEIKANGGDVVSGVSKKTTHLIVADPTATTSKITKAKSLLDCKVLTIEEFKKL